MNFKAHTENEEKTTYFKLFDDGIGNVDLNVVDKSGDKIIRILTIGRNGIHLSGAVPSSAGLPLDEEGLVEVSGKRPNKLK